MPHLMYVMCDNGSMSLTEYSPSSQALSMTSQPVEPLVMSWLASFSSPKTRQAYGYDLRRFSEWLDHHKAGGLLNEHLEEAREAILNLEVMPSMRCLMVAGPALERNHISAYNCAYAAVDHVRFFDECLLILMHGTGVGFSVERQFINQLPEVPGEFTDTDDIIVVADSKEGWQEGFRKLLVHLYAG